MEENAQAREGQWRIVLLGSFAVYDEVADKPSIKFRTHRSSWLLARLATNPGFAHSRDVLAEWLWPEKPPETQRARLRYELSLLRQVLGKEAVLSVGNVQVALAEARVTSDAADFLLAVRERRWQDATGLYAGDFCPGIFDDWILAKRDELRILARNAFNHALAAAITCGELEEAHRLHRSMALHFEGDPLPAVPPPVPDVIDAALAAAPAAPPPVRTRRLLAASLQATLRSVRTRLDPVRPRLRKAAWVVGAGVFSASALAGADSRCFPRWSLTREFSTLSPSFGPWELGALDEKTGRLTPMHRARRRVIGNENDPFHWTGGYARGDVLKNLARPASPGVYDAIWKVGQTYFHPGHQMMPPACVRWTAPHTGYFRVAARFDGVSLNAVNGTTVDLLLSHNGRTVWRDAIRGTVAAVVPNNKKPSASFNGVINLRSGDTLDFTVTDAGEWEADMMAATIDVSDTRTTARRAQWYGFLAVFALLSAAGIWVRAKASARQKGEFPPSASGAPP